MSQHIELLWKKIDHLQRMQGYKLFARRRMTLRARAVANKEILGGDTATSTRFCDERYQGSIL